MKKRTYVDKPLGDTEYLLEQWGWWRMDGMGVPRYVSPLYALIRDNNVTEGGIKNYCVTDDVALVVDRAVAKLATRDSQMGNFIWLYFGAKWPALRIARENDMGEAKARELIKAGVAWVDCAIEVFREAA
ncbi:MULTISPECIES: antiterminator Q family protein [Pseudomonas]|uniref:antiterminator Q family protein n=1 Tax=Pseudomonas TaxID=286 RepID=UPI000CF6ED3D|nr:MULTISPECIES: antiterminator Q family protein [Pseudomonas]AVJ40206.1 antitermination protein Q [Pseudomonas lurida]PRA14324.1 antitermination protein Q [Pseudomonas sp. MYb13]PRA18105.1 antitermination protein Q [Pseudomonas lurida]PRA31007.1 antitermination protein Q [Pseudomonas lurida]PRB97159.1 antitermination protein Q [Pseudomonas lurida]